MDRITRCAPCEDLPPHCSQPHEHSRSTKYQDNINITAENTNNHGSNQCGNIWKCATSGAIRPITANNIGIPQQNICGAIVAIIPILTALFFILFYPIFWRPQQGSNLYLILRRNLFYPVELWGRQRDIIIKKNSVQ